MTGLQGSWDFSIRWTERNLLNAAGADGIPLNDAIEKQLGLKLEARMVPVPVIAVDSVNEKPTDNPPGVSESLTAIPTRFEVADIKPSASGSAQRSVRMDPGGRVDARGFTLKDLIKFAWEISDLDVIDNDDMLAGMSKGLGDERFDIVAEASSDGLPAGTRLDTNSARLMLRGLLEDRFKLTTHSEQRPVMVYRMVASKPKLKRADPANRPGCRPGAALSASSPVFSLHCQNTTLAQLADELPAYGALYVNHPVVDETGLEGGWDFDLGWSPPHLVHTGEMAAANDPNGALTIVEALDKQLGLKLEPGKHEMPVLVIDHVEAKPTEN